MQISASEGVESCPALLDTSSQVLGTSIVLDLEKFPELNWLPTYLIALTALQQELDRLSQAIQAIAAEGDVYQDYWIEPYTKTKNGRQYTYHQLRWLTGERKQSGQPQVKTKHLSHRAVGEVRAAIARGQQVAALEQQRQQVEAERFRLQQLVLGTKRRLKRICSQNSIASQLHDHPL